MELFKINNIEIGHYILKRNISIDSDYFNLYFNIEQGIKSKDLKKLKETLPDNFDILKYIEIENKFRNRGYGQKLLSMIINSTENSIVLIAETTNSFLVDFYLKNNFEIIGYCNNLPIMLLKR